MKTKKNCWWHFIIDLILIGFAILMITTSFDWITVTISVLFIFFVILNTYTTFSKYTYSKEELKKSVEREQRHSALMADNNARVEAQLRMNREWEEYKRKREEYKEKSGLNKTLEEIRKNKH